MKTLFIGLLGLTLFALMSTSHASEDAFKDVVGQAILKSKMGLLDCDKVIDDATSQGITLPTIPSLESLNKAILIYQVSSEVGKCLYPNVTVTRQPVGEYEEYKSGGPELVTLTNRTVYRWGDYEVQEALITTPEHLNIEVIPNGTGYRVSLSSEDK